MAERRSAAEPALEATGPASSARGPGAAPLIVVMGVSGSGKTVMGSALAAALSARFAEGDRFHPPANIARMSGGLPLRDEDRWGWLDAIAGEIARSAAAGEPLVVACSALKRAYRDRLRSASPRLRFVFLAIDRPTAAQRVAARADHFMPASLIDSQFQDLQPPAADEHAIVAEATREPYALLAFLLESLSVGAGGGAGLTREASP